METLIRITSYYSNVTLIQNVLTVMKKENDKNCADFLKAALPSVIITLTTEEKIYVMLYE